MQSDLESKRTVDGEAFKMKGEVFVLPFTMLLNFVAYKRTSSLSKLNLACRSPSMADMVFSQNSHKITNKITGLSEATKSSPRLNLVKDALFPAKSTTDLRTPSSEITGEVRTGQSKDCRSKPTSGILVQKSMNESKKETIQR